MKMKLRKAVVRWARRDDLSAFAKYWVHNGFVTVEGREDVQVAGEFFVGARFGRRA